MPKTAVSLAGALKGLRMKIKDVTEGVWDGVKNIGKGLGQVAGGVAMGALRGLDKLGGGTGQVGTRAQVAAYNAANKAKQMAAIKANLPQEALTDFKQNVAQLGVNLDDARTFNPDQMEEMLKHFGVEYFSGGQGQGIKSYIKQTSASVPVPNIINSKSVLQYFTRMNQLKDDAMAIVSQAGTGKAVAGAHPAGGKTAPGIALVNDFPPIVSYKNKNYSLDNGFWEDEKGNRPKNPYQVFLYRQADILIPGSEEVNREFDKFEKSIAGGTTAPTTQAPAAKPIQVKVGNEVITKGNDGRWYDPAGDFIGDPNDIAELERRSNQAPGSAGAYIK